MTSITLRWAGPADATSGSTYLIERTTDNVSFLTLAFPQAATSPYVSPLSTLSGNTDYGATSVVLASGTAFSTSGWGWIDDALIQWTGKTSNTLTGVTWHSGYGTYASGSTVYEAHESYADTATITLKAVLYRVTHYDAAGNASAPTYIWYYSPPAPASSQHCVVIVPIGADLGVDMQDSVPVQAYLSNGTQFGEFDGQNLTPDVGIANSQTTNAFGLAFFHCWRDSARFNSAGGADAKYTFLLLQGKTPVTITPSVIPDRDWVLLSQIF